MCMRTRRRLCHSFEQPGYHICRIHDLPRLYPRDDFVFTEVCSESFIFLYEQERWNTLQVAEEVNEFLLGEALGDVPFDGQPPAPAVGGASANQPQPPAAGGASANQPPAPAAGGASVNQPPAKR